MIPLLLIFAMYFLPGPVQISVRPKVAFPPGAFLVRATIERDPGNRQLVLEAVRYGVFRERRTPFQIDGAQRQRVFTPTNKCICWSDLPAGEYEAVATLTRIVEGKTQTYVAREPFRVLGGGVLGEGAHPKFPTAAIAHKHGLNRRRREA